MVGPHIEPDEMHAVLDREAGIDAEERIHRHLAGCDPCRARYAGWLLPGLLARPSLGIAADAPPQRIRASRRWLVAAALLVSTAAALHITSLPSRSPSPAPQLDLPARVARHEQNSRSGLLAIQVVRERSGPDSRSRETWTLQDDGSVVRRSERRLAGEPSPDAAVSATVVRTTRQITMPSIAAATGVFEITGWSSR